MLISERNPRTVSWRSLRIDMIGRSALSSTAQFTDHVFGFAEHKGDRSAVRRLSNACDLVAFGCADGETDELPGRSKPVHHQDQAVEKYVRPAAFRRSRMTTARSTVSSIDFVESICSRSIGDDVIRQAAAQIGERFTQRQKRNQRIEVFQRPRRTDLNGLDRRRVFSSPSIVATASRIRWTARS